MSGIQDLIDVQFIDQTNYPDIVSGDDVMGIVINHFWGPADLLRVYNKTSFYEAFPESLPIGVTAVDPNNYHGFAMVKKAFDLGLPNAEVRRINSGHLWGYQQWNLVEESGTATFTKQSEPQINQFGSEGVSIALKYPGYVPQSLAPGFVNIAVQAAVGVVDGVKTITVNVLGLKYQGDLTPTILEQFQGWADPNQAVEGQSYYLPNVINGKSAFIAVNVADGLTDMPTLAETKVDCGEFPAEEPVFNADTQGQNVIYSYKKDFANIQKSRATLLVNPFHKDFSGSPETSVLEVDKEILNVAAQCKNRLAVIGYPVNLPYVPGDSPNDSNTILGYRNSATYDKFGLFVNGRDMIKVMGMNLESNCVAGWVGATAKIAKEVRLNQMASAETYGAYAGTLTETLEFDDVLRLHDQYGIISVYRAYTGPQIFGVRSMNKKQTSYFGKANVMRVTAAILREVFPLAIDAVHTDTASNPITRSTFETSLNSIINRFAAKQNLKPQSNAVCDSNINSDTLTNGGEILNIILNLWYIKLTERVQIKIVATDSSVTAEII